MPDLQNESNRVRYLMEECLPRETSFKDFRPLNIAEEKPLKPEHITYIGNSLKRGYVNYLWNIYSRLLKEPEVILPPGRQTKGSKNMVYKEEYMQKLQALNDEKKEYRIKMYEKICSEL